MPYLLDTNAWIDYFKRPTSLVRSRLSLLQPTDVVTCSIVRSELLHGAEKYGNVSRRVSLIETTLAPFKSFPFDDQDAEKYAGLRHFLEQSGSVIGPYDLQIAAICLRHQFTIVTHNVGEFSRIPGLSVQDWQ